MYVYTHTHTHTHTQGETIAPGLDKSKKANQPSLGLKNFKNASKKGQVSETPIGSPRAMQVSGERDLILWQNRHNCMANAAY
jgi:hypothetical protein